MPDPDRSQPGSHVGSGERSRPPGTFRIGTIAGTDVLVTSSWFLIAGLIAVFMAPAVERVAPGLGGFRYVAGVAFAVILYFSVLLHEVSHALMARHFGFTVSSITLHFLGGMTAIEGESRRPREEALIAVVGPITSLAVGAFGYALYTVESDGLIGIATSVLAGANLLVGVLNLVPGLPLDGGRVLRAGVWSATGSMHTGTVVAGWGGRVAAVAALFYPLLLEQVTGRPAELIDFLLAFVVALFLWSGANAAISSAKVRRRLPMLVARNLARRTITVPDDLPLAEAVRRANEAQAGSIVTVTHAGRPVGLVNEAAVLATPEDRRPWVAVSTVSRTLVDGLTLPAAITGEDLVVAITRTPSEEYLLTEPDGTIYGVLATADVDRAFREGGGRA